MAAGCHFLHVFPSFDPGGMEVRASQVMDLLPAPHRHTVIAMSGRMGCASRVRRADLTVAPAPPPAGFLATGRAMAARIAALRPDLVLTYNWGAIETVLGCRLAGQRALIHHEEGFGIDESERLLRRRAWARRMLLRRVHAVVLPSQALREVALHEWRVPAALARYLPNGVDLDRFTPHPTAADGDVTIGCVAHFRPEKDVPALVDAFARCTRRRQAQLVLVGDGPDRPRAAALAEALGVGDRVHFQGAVGDTAPQYGGFDVFALASRTEQMPLVVLEAMAAGLPIAAPAVGDIADMVDPANAPFLVPPRDPDALARALDGLIADRAQRARLGAANRARCLARYRLADRLAAHCALYREVLGERVEVAGPAVEPA